MAIQCPECEGTDVKKVSLVYEEGTSTTKSGMVGVGLASGGMGGGVALGKAVERTNLAQRLAPPPKPPAYRPPSEPEGWGVVLIYIVMFIGITCALSSAIFFLLVQRMNGLVLAVGTIGLVCLISAYVSYTSERGDYTRRNAFMFIGITCVLSSGIFFLLVQGKTGLVLVYGGFVCVISACVSSTPDRSDYERRKGAYDADFQEKKGRYERWDRSFVCLTCGHIFEPMKTKDSS